MTFRVVQKVVERLDVAVVDGLSFALGVHERPSADEDVLVALGAVDDVGGAGGDRLRHGDAALLTDAAGYSTRSETDSDLSAAFPQRNNVFLWLKTYKQKTKHAPNFF